MWVVPMFCGFLLREKKKLQGQLYHLLAYFEAVKTLLPVFFASSEPRTSVTEPCSRSV